MINPTTWGLFIKSFLFFHFQLKLCFQILKWWIWLWNLILEHTLFLTGKLFCHSSSKAVYSDSYSVIFWVSFFIIMSVLLWWISSNSASAFILASRKSSSLRWHFKLYSSNFCFNLNCSAFSNSLIFWARLWEGSSLNNKNSFWLKVLKTNRVVDLKRLFENVHSCFGFHSQCFGELLSSNSQWPGQQIFIVLMRFMQTFLLHSESVQH